MSWLIVVGYWVAALTTMRLSFVKLRAERGEKAQREDHVAGSFFMGLGWPITVVVFILAVTVFRPTAAEHQQQKKAELERQLHELRRERDAAEKARFEEDYWEVVD